MMWRWNKTSVDDGKLKLIENEIFRAFDAESVEVEAAGTSPFFYRRLRARIEAENRQRAEAGSIWGAWLLTARQATPALALVALLALGGFWSASESTGQNAASGETAVNLLAPGEVSQDELVAAVLGWERQEANTPASSGSTPAPEKEQR